MRISKDVSFPYPVLGIGNSMKTQLDASSVDVKVIPDDKQYHITVELSYDNEDIKKYIEDGYAEYYFELNCSSTLYREVKPENNPRHTFDINKTDINKQIEISSFVTVKKAIEDYKNSDFRHTYSHPLNYEVGEVLAVFPCRPLPIALSYGSIKNPCSLLTIQSSDTDCLDFDCDGQQIVVKMPTALYEKYHGKMSRSSKVVEIKHIAMPAFTHALFHLEEGILNNYTWAIALKYKIGLVYQDNSVYDEICELAKDKEDSNAFNELQKVAQKILDDPFNSFTDYLIEQQNKNEN